MYLMGFCDTRTHPGLLIAPPGINVVSGGKWTSPTRVLSSPRRPGWLRASAGRNRTVHHFSSGHGGRRPGGSH